MLAPALAAVGPGFYEHGSGFADFDRLRAFMLSFAPRLVPRHMATPGGAQLADAVRDALRAAGESPTVIGSVEQGRGVKSEAKGKGLAEAVRYSVSLRA